MQQLPLFGIEQSTSKALLPEELFEAYSECRRNKRRSLAALEFEVDYETRLLRLCDEINNGTYTPARSNAFLVTRPQLREIFAAPFRDRIVHHLIYRKLNPLFEKAFIYDNYACRSGKGTHLGIRRLDRFIRRCSANYTRPCYVLKLDIEGFFMHIDKTILWQWLAEFIRKNYLGADHKLVLRLCRTIIDYDPTVSCVFRSDPSAWRNLPRSKSLFHTPDNCGLPIGNLTSQMFANFYLNPLDHYIKKHLGIRYYGRYVDDLVLVHRSRQYLKSVIARVQTKLADDHRLSLHPGKTYLQHYSKGVQFLGAVIKPNRVYIRNRTKGNFYAAIIEHNAVVETGRPSRKQKEAFQSSMNSYLGLMKHCNSYRLRQRMLTEQLSPWWWHHFCVDASWTKLISRTAVNKSALSAASQLMSGRRAGVGPPINLLLQEQFLKSTIFNA